MKRERLIFESKVIGNDIANHLLEGRKTGSNVYSLKSTTIESKFAETGYIVISAQRGEYDDAYNFLRTEQLEKFIKERGYYYIKVEGGYIENIDSSAEIKEGVNKKSLRRDKYDKYSRYSSYGFNDKIGKKYVDDVSDFGVSDITSDKDREELKTRIEHFEIAFIVQNRKKINRIRRGKRVNHDFNELFEFGKKMCRLFKQESFLVREPTDIRFFSTIEPDILNLDTEETWEEDGITHSNIIKADFKTRRFPAYYVNQNGHMTWKFTHWRENQMKQDYFTSFVFSKSHIDFVNLMNTYLHKDRDGEFTDKEGKRPYITYQTSHDSLLGMDDSPLKIKRFTFFG